MARQLNLNHVTTSTGGRISLKEGEALDELRHKLSGLVRVSWHSVLKLQNKLRHQLVVLTVANLSLNISIIVQELDEIQGNLLKHLDLPLLYVLLVLLKFIDSCS